LEYFATLASIHVKDYKYPKKDLDDMWENVLLYYSSLSFSQFVKTVSLVSLLFVLCALCAPYSNSGFVPTNLERRITFGIFGAGLK